MALTINFKEMPGYKMARALYDKFPGKGIVKKAAFLTVAISAAFAAGGVAILGIAAIVGFGIWLFSLPLLAALGVIITLSVIFALVVAGIRYIYNFNVQISDKEIEANIKNSFNKYYGLLGEFSGKLVGYLVCGAIPGALAFCVNKHVAAAIFENLGDEAKDELLADLTNMARSVLGTLVNAMVLKQFKSARRYLKKKPNHPISQMIIKHFGAAKFKQWGEQDGKQWSIGSKVEQQVESIKDPNLRNFTEEFLENFSEACIESGYIIANTIDAHLAAQSMINRRMGLAADEEMVRVSITP